MKIPASCQIGVWIGLGIIWSSRNKNLNVGWFPAAGAQWVQPRNQGGMLVGQTTTTGGGSLCSNYVFGVGAPDSREAVDSE